MSREVHLLLKCILTKVVKRNIQGYKKNVFSKCTFTWRVRQNKIFQRYIHGTNSTYFRTLDMFFLFGHMYNKNSQVFCKIYLIIELWGTRLDRYLESHFRTALNIFSPPPLFGNGCAVSWSIWQRDISPIILKSATLIQTPIII